MKRTPLRRVSTKRAAQLREYAKIRTQFLREAPFCETPGCINRSIDVHHMKGRYGELLNDRKWWMAVCRVCHTFIEDHKNLARKQGLILY